MNKKIIKIRKDDTGDVTDIMLSNGDILPLNRVITLAKEGAIEGVQVGQGRNGTEFLKIDFNESDSDNLNNLPIF